MLVFHHPGSQIVEEGWPVVLSVKLQTTLTINLQMSCSVAHLWMELMICLGGKLENFLTLGSVGHKDDVRPHMYAFADKRGIAYSINDDPADIRMQLHNKSTICVIAQLKRL
jgi:hypothetical protein